MLACVRTAAVFGIEATPVQVEVDVSFGLPALRYDEKSRGARAYLALAGELTRREQETATTAPSPE